MNGSRSIHPGPLRDALVALGEQSQVVDESIHSGDLSVHVRGGGFDLALGRVLRAAEHIDLAPDRGQGRAQLVRGVGDERALPCERVLEPVEHVVEGLGQLVHLPGAPLGHPMREVAGVDRARRTRPFDERRGDSGGDPERRPAMPRAR